MTYFDVFGKAKETIEKLDFSSFSGHLAVEIEITGEGEGVYYIELSDGKVSVEPYDYHDRDCRLAASAENFMKIVSGKLDPVAAFTVGKLKVEGSVEKALEFGNVLKAARKESK